jgi:hypothetical protein
MKTPRLLQRLFSHRSLGAAPIFVVAAPLADLALLTGLIAQAERIAPLQSTAPLRQRIECLLASQCRPSSDRLDNGDITPGLVTALRQALSISLRQRLLDAHSTHALRIPALAAAFPQAQFVFLMEEPREQLARMIAAWRSGRSITRPALDGWDGPWSLPLIPGWEVLRGQSIPEIALAQWATITTTLLDDLGRLAPERWSMLGAGSLHTNSQQARHLLARFGGLRWRHTPCLAEQLAHRHPLTPAEYRDADVLLPLTILHTGVCPRSFAGQSPEAQSQHRCLAQPSHRRRLRTPQPSR